MQIIPVFIAGCDRSGTTMLGDILGSAEGSFAVPESQWIHEYSLMLQVGGFDSPLTAATWLREHFRFKVWDLQLSTQQLAELIDLGNLRVTVSNIIAAYLTQNDRPARGTWIWCDHTPDNFKFYPLLKAHFPDAKYIHIVRDGRAVYQSIRNLDWGPNNAYMATRYWTARIQQALQVEIAEGSNCRRVRYEDIVKSPEDTIRALCMFTGQRYEASMIEGGGLILPGFTKKQHKLVGSRPDPSRVESWRIKLSKRQIAEFEAYPWSRLILGQMGYELVTTKARHQSFVTVLLRYVHDSFMYMWHRQKHRRMEMKTVNKTGDE